MIYKYEIACREAGLEEDKIREIRNMFNADYQKMFRQKKQRKESGLQFLSVEGMKNAEGDVATYDIPDPDVDVEEQVIHSMDLERLQMILGELPEEDKEFMLEYFSGENNFLNAMAEKYGMTRDQVIYRKRKLLKQIRERFFADEK